MSTNTIDQDLSNSSEHDMFWKKKYQAKATGWDLGVATPPLKTFIDEIKNTDSSILIPGCGNAYEAEYLLSKGFTNITLIDFAPMLVKQLQAKFANQKNIKVILGNFFDHIGKYDLILEQTFFCALPPNLRQRYVWKMHQLLNENGILSGLLFNRAFEIGPPFGGNSLEYQRLFQHSFLFEKFAVAENSIKNRTNTELFFIFKKDSTKQIKLYTCEHGNMIKDELITINDVVNVSVNTDESELLLVSNVPINLEILRKNLEPKFEEIIKIKN